MLLEAFMAEHKKICTPVRPLLPASAAAFAPRALHIVLGVNVKRWLTLTLNRTTGLRLNSSIRKHQSCLTKTLSSSTAIWTLASPHTSQSTTHRTRGLYLGNTCFPAYSYRSIYHLNRYGITERDRIQTGARLNRIPN